MTESAVCMDTTVPQGSQGALDFNPAACPLHAQQWRCWGVHGHGQLGQAGRRAEMGWQAAQSGTTYPTGTGAAGVAALQAKGRGGPCEQQQQQQAERWHAAGGSALVSSSAAAHLSWQPRNQCFMNLGLFLGVWGICSSTCSCCFVHVPV